jgi:hypothetical protein
MSFSYILPSNVLFFPFDDGAVLFCKGSRKLWVLNSTSAFIWCLLDETTINDELVEHYSSTFHVEKSKALNDVNAILAGFGREGLLDNKVCLEDSKNDGAWNIKVNGSMIHRPGKWPIRRFYRVANHLFEFCCQDAAIGRIFTEIMEHMAKKFSGEVSTRLAVVYGNGNAQKFDIYLGNQPVMFGLNENEVIPELLRLFFIHSCETFEARLLFHAAVIQKGNSVVMFPGEAGSGKTTIVAALLSGDCSFYSDELAVLDTEDLTVTAIPLPMSIKPGSVKPLERYYDKLKDLMIHLRNDGKKVRYLSPSLKNLPAEENRVQVDSLVFPKYIQGGDNQICNMDKKEALSRLARTGSSNRALTENDVKAMIALIEERNCYELKFSDLGEAISSLEEHVFSCQ